MNKSKTYKSKIEQSLKPANKIYSISHDHVSHQLQSHQNSEIEFSFLQNIRKTQAPISAERPQKKNIDLQSHRKEQTIDITSIQTLKKRRFVKKGRTKQTTNLSKYVYREIMSFLQLIFRTNQMTPTLHLAVKEFKKGKGVLSSYKKLFKHPMFLKTCLQNLETATFVRNILRSTRMEMQSKLTIIKFMERIRMNCIKSTGRWKQQVVGERRQMV